jgi:hypothetical protein
VWKILRAAGLDREFKCEGVSDLADLRAILNDLESPAAGSYTFRYPVAATGPQSPIGHSTFDMMAFAKQIDSILDLLDATADGLAAMSNQRDDPVEEVEVPSRPVN